MSIQIIETKLYKREFLSNSRRYESQIMSHKLWLIIYDGLRELQTERNPDIQSSETLFAWIQECGWNKESYQPQFNQHWTTIEPPFTTMATIEPLLTIETWTLQR